MGRLISNEMSIEKVFKEQNLFDVFIPRDVAPGVTVYLAKLKSQSDDALCVQAISFAKPQWNEIDAIEWLDSNKKLYSSDALKKYAEEKEPSNDKSLPDSKGKSISGVEIFSVGKWNGDDYTINDLDEMVRAFEENQETLKPYLKLGHDKDQNLVQTDGYPAAGWITKLKRVGKKLVADFSNVPSKVFDLISKGAYRKVSSEIYWDIAINDKKYKRFLSGVALLGSDMPAVTNLNDIIALYSLKKYTDNESKVKIYDYEGSPIMSKTENEIKLELELQKAKEALEQKSAELKEYSSKDEAHEALKKDYAKAQEQIAKIESEKAAAELEAFITGLKEITPAMKPFALELLGAEKKEYSVKEKQYSKRELFEEILKLHSAKDVNLDESSENAEGKTTEEELLAKIEAYAAENKVSYSQAYKTVMKEKK